MSMRSSVVFAMVLVVVLICGAPAFTQEPAGAAPRLRLAIRSAGTIEGAAGDFVTVEGDITNTTAGPISDITTYLSLVDTGNKLPVDLEDWSVEKGLYIGTIGPGETFPLRWKIHFVKAGSYSLVVIAQAGGFAQPTVSRITTLRVEPKHNLNPGAVLPVALGVPVLLVLFLFTIAALRKKE